MEAEMPRRRRSQDQITRTIGQRLALLRKARGLTQVELAQQLGVTQGNVSAYERGELRLYGDLIVKLAKILKASTDEILGLASPPKAPAIKDRRFLRRIELIDRLPKRDRDAILRILLNASLARTHPVEKVA
jgi:transcriptional regulator with XRE-family HTH domain